MTAVMRNGFLMIRSIFCVRMVSKCRYRKPTVDNRNVTVRVKLVYPTVRCCHIALAYLLLVSSVSPSAAARMSSMLNFSASPSFGSFTKSRSSSAFLF